MMKIRNKRRGFVDVRGEKKFHLLKEGEELTVSGFGTSTLRSVGSMNHFGGYSPEIFICWATANRDDGQPFDRLVEVYREDCEVIK